MTAYLLLIHLLNLALPAAVLALLMSGLGTWLAGRRGAAPLVASWQGRLAWALVLNLAVLVVGLVWFRADGKAATLGALVLVSALAQFVMWRGWRR